MRAGAAQPQAVNRRAVLGPAEQWPHRVELVEGQLAVMDVAADESPVALEIGGGEHLGRDNQPSAAPGI